MLFISKLINILRVIKSVRSQNLSKSLKNKTLKNYFKCIVLNHFYDKQKSFKLSGYTVHYSVYGGFAYAFNDIFINNDYWFESDNDTPFIIDCGSNIGLSIIYFKQIFPQSEIISFEPDLDAYECLVKNIKQNAITNIETHNKALSSTECTLKLNYDKERPGSIKNSTEDITSISYREVPAVKLSNYINKTVDFIKMDIEGAETSVIEELDTSGKLKYIKHIILEYHHHIGAKKDCLSVILNILEKNNFSYQFISSYNSRHNIDEPHLMMIHCVRNL